MLKNFIPQSRSFGRGTIISKKPSVLSIDMEADFKHFHAYFDGVEGKHPKLV
ncbi:MAG: hypothetical protein L3J20_14035 [Flavobacteriaceae bacterium]|nr:hypothetical protein [Flavobacteriaceae bacterium]